MSKISIAIAVGLLSTCLQAQWINQPTVGIPRTKDGKAAMTAPAPKTADGKPDLSGLWTLVATGGGIKQQLKPSEMKPWAQQLFKEREENLGKESPGTQCLPAGFYLLGLVKIVQTPGLMVMLGEDLTYRQIFTDGRELPKDPNPAWMGYSIGHWEGDTLVVESTGYNERTWLDAGYPHTEQMRVTERYRRTDFGHLTGEVTFSDPAIYEKPITYKMNGGFTADTELLEYVCAENNKDVSHLVGHNSDDTKRAVKLPSEVLSKYVGSYRYRAKDFGIPGVEFFDVNISLENAELMLSFAGTPGQPMIALSETVFTGVGGYVEFGKNDRGEVTHMVIKIAEGDFRGDRKK